VSQRRLVWSTGTGNENGTDLSVTIHSGNEETEIDKKMETRISSLSL